MVSFSFKENILACFLLLDYSEEVHVSIDKLKGNSILS